jgi:hypothetical protein
MAVVGRRHQNQPCYVVIVNSTQIRQPRAASAMINLLQSALGWSVPSPALSIKASASAPNPLKLRPAGLSPLLLRQSKPAPARPTPSSCARLVCPLSCSANQSQRQRAQPPQAAPCWSVPPCPASRGQLSQRELEVASSASLSFRKLKRPRPRHFAGRGVRGEGFKCCCPPLPRKSGPVEPAGARGAPSASKASASSTTQAPTFCGEGG